MKVRILVKGYITLWWYTPVLYMSTYNINMFTCLRINVNIQHNFVSMRDNYANMRLKCIVNIIKLHVDITYLACMGQKYIHATIVYIIRFWQNSKEITIYSSNENYIPRGQRPRENDSYHLYHHVINWLLY